MSKTPPGTVKDTGVKAGSYLWFEGDSLLSAAELINAIASKGGAARMCMHILNRNKLRLETKAVK